MDGNFNFVAFAYKNKSAFNLSMKISRIGPLTFQSKMRQQ
jgi:hypothetical protein